MFLQEVNVKNTNSDSNVHNSLKVAVGIQTK